MKHWKLILAAVIILPLLGEVAAVAVRQARRHRATLVHSEICGTILDADVVPGHDWMRIRTTETVVIIRQIVPVPLREKAVCATWSDGHHSIGWSGMDGDPDRGYDCE